MIASVAALSIEELVSVAQALTRAGANLIEINLNDPHVHDHVHPFQSVTRLDEVVATLRDQITAPLAIKLPPRVPLDIAAVAHTLVKNDIPAAMCHNASADGGPSQAQTVLAATDGVLDVIGVGRVATGAQALSILRQGVRAIQVGSAVFKEGVGVFARLKQEMAELSGTEAEKLPS